MDPESRLKKIEAQVQQIRTLVWIVLALVLTIGVGFLLVAVKLGLLPPVLWWVGHVWLILVAFILIVTVYLLVFCLLASVLSGLRQWRTGRAANARIFREAIAERAKALHQDSDP